jgi:hypothetical protein
MMFLFTFIYILLIAFPVNVSQIEWFVFAYVVAHGMEHFRKVLSFLGCHKKQNIHLAKVFISNHTLK